MGNPALSPRQRLIALAIVAVYLSTTLALAFTERPQSDEAIYANPGYNLLDSGKMGITLYPLPDFLPLSTAQRTYIQPPLYFVATAALFRVVGFGLFQVRFLSIFFGLICLLAWYAIVRSLTQAIAPALLVAGLISVDYFFLIAASHGRMDMMCVGLGSAGLALYMTWRRDHLLRACFWGNLLTALALLTHPTGLAWAAGLWLAMLLLDWPSLSIKLLGTAAIPYLLVGAAWGSYIAQDPQAFREQMRQALIINEGSFDYSHLSRWRVIRYVQQELLTRYAAPFGLLSGVALASRLKALVLVSYLTGILGILLTKRLRQKNFLLWFPLFFLGAFFILAEISPSKFNYYLPHTTVPMAACLGMFLFAVRQSPQWKPILAVVALLAGIQLAGAARLIRLDEYHSNYLPVIDVIQRNAPPNSLIMSQGELWLGLWRDHRVLDDNRLGFLSGLRPNIFVMDPVFRDLHERDHLSDPAAYQHVEAMIAHSRSIYKDDYSQVYLTDPLSR